MEVYSTADAQMKQISPSSASSVAAGRGFVIAVAAVDCDSGSCVSSVPFCLSRPLEFFPPRVRGLDPLSALLPVLRGASVQAEGGAPPRPRRRPPRPEPNDAGAVGGLSVMSEASGATVGVDRVYQWQRDCTIKLLSIVGWWGILILLVIM